MCVLCSNFDLAKYDTSRYRAAKTFTNAREGTIYHSLYNSKMTEDSFIKKSVEVTIKEFLEKRNSVLYTFIGHIPKDLCKVLFSYC